jgi:hypothetical protein
VTVTKNEILYSLNKPDDFILAIVEFMEDGSHRVHYVRRPFQQEPDFGVTSVNYDFGELLGGATMTWRQLAQWLRSKEDHRSRLRLRIEVHEVFHPDGRVLVFSAPARPLGTPSGWKGPTGCGPVKTWCP